PDGVHSLPEALAAWFTRFEQIHPFLDGNGRTGRLLMNLVLIRLGYPPALIFRRQRTKYLEALRRADAGALGLLGEFPARSILETLHKFIVPALAGPHRLVSITSLTDGTITLRALRAAAIRGRLKAQHGRDGQWYSTRNAVEEYKKSRQR
ncbi:MAG: Fic family protein, partial [Chloroflexota bacterium]